MAKKPLRPSRRDCDTLRETTLHVGYSPYAEGSCLIKMGGTHVLCTASVERGVPPFLKGTGKGWITAEYGMLPRSTHARMHRAKTAESGRTLEIQRLIGRALRAVTDTKSMGEYQIRLDCDVIQADGGTRTASITGAYVALKCAEQWMMNKEIINAPIVTGALSAVSCGIFKNTCMVDLDYKEDSNASADANFVLTAGGEIVEIQGTAEQAPFSKEDFIALLGLAEQGCHTLNALQEEALSAFFASKEAL